MDIYEIKLHYYQKQILKKLLYSKEDLHFNQLIIDGLESEHVNYHIQKLIDFGLINKDNKLYHLTNKGKDFVNTMDDQTQIVEKQPKVSVLIRVRRYNDEKQEYEHLLYKKLRQPYFGKVGQVGGKVRFGESMEEAAKRELFEETGLMVNKLTLIEVYRKMRSDEKSEPVQDVIFFIYRGEEISGHLIEKTEFQENFWATEKEILKREDLFDDFKLVKDSEILRFKESQDVVKGF